jgi:hypothetical protein
MDLYAISRLVNLLRAARDESRLRRRLTCQSRKSILQTLKEKSIERMLTKAMTLVDMIEEEKSADYLAKAFHFVAVFHEKQGELRKAKEWATKELDMYQLAELDSLEARLSILMISAWLK